MLVRMRVCTVSDGDDDDCVAGAGVEGSGVLPEPYCGGSARRQRCEEDRDGDWCKEVFVFGFCARLSSEKGPALFMHAARVVEEQGLLPRAVFVILGSSHSKTFGNAMRALAQQYNVSRVRGSPLTRVRLFVVLR